MRFFVFAQLFASKSWKSRQRRQTPGREGLFVILFVRPRSPKRFNWLCEVVVFVRCFEVCRTSELPEKGFNCCGAKLLLRRAASRFAEPRSSPERERVVTFCIVQKVTKKHARGLRTSGLRGSDSKLCRKYF